MMRCRCDDFLTTGTLCGALLLASCDCVRTVHALVVDQATGQPIEGARVRERHGDGQYEDEYFLTNDSGLFEFDDISGGFRCPPVQLHISKDGYIPVDRDFGSSSHGDTVLLRAEPWRYKAW